MRFSFSLFQFVDVQVEKAAFSISSVTVITLQIVHFIFLVVNTHLKKFYVNTHLKTFYVNTHLKKEPILPFFCFEFDQIVEVFRRLFCSEGKVGGKPSQSAMQCNAAPIMNGSKFTILVDKLLRC